MKRGIIISIIAIILIVGISIVFIWFFNSEIKVIEYTGPVKVGPGGAIVIISDQNSPLYGTMVNIPKGALIFPINLTIEESHDNTPHQKGIDSAVRLDDPNPTSRIKFGPAGTVFKKKIEITMPYKDENDDGILDNTTFSEEKLGILYYDADYPDRWFYELVIGRDTVRNTITIKTDHFSTTVG